jgi:hypothetical protein
MNRAFLVGINAYPGNELSGCVNDVTDMAHFLVRKCDFRERDIRLLTDRRATRDGIWQRLGWLLNGVRPGDRLLFHYSGHGAQMPTRDPMGEVDGLDEVICPVDFDWSEAHVIRDKDFNRLFSQVPAGVEFVWVSDSCHSGDLTRGFPAPRAAGGRHKTLLPPADIDWRLQTALSDGTRARGMVNSARGLNVSLVAGCRSDETSSDAVFNGRPNGALTYYLLKELGRTDGLEIPMQTLVHRTASDLASGGYRSQHPQLEGSATISDRAFLSPAKIHAVSKPHKVSRAGRGKHPEAATAH